MKKYTAFFFLACLSLLSGCSTNLKSTIAPGASVKGLGKVFVVHFGPDDRQLNTIIADRLTLLGHPASAGEERNIPKDVDTVVTYKDNWDWNMTTYMSRISIQFRTGKGKQLIASGESRRSSFARKTPEEMIEETLKDILK